MKLSLLLGILPILCISTVKAGEVGDVSLNDTTSANTSAIHYDSSLDNKIWGKGRFTRLGYSIAQTAEANANIEKGEWGFFFTKGTTYLFPKKAWGGLVKVGVDAVWFDFQVSRYKAPYSDESWTSTPWDNLEQSDDDMDFDIGRLGLSMGVGVGPNVSIAPFAISSIDILKPLRFSLYFHYNPTLMMYMMSQDGDMEVSTAYCNMMQFCGTIKYRKLGIGIEGFWGQGKFKPIDFSKLIGDDEEFSSLGSRKYTRKYANLRFYIQVTF